MAGRKSNTALSTKTLKEKVGEEQLVRSKLTEELSSLLSLFVSLDACRCVPCSSVFLLSFFFVDANKAIYRGSRGERAP